MTNDSCLAAAMKWWWFWPLLLMAGVLGERIGHFYISQVISEPPVYVMKSTMINTFIRPGESLRFIVTRPAQAFGRNCDGRIVREIHHDQILDGVVVNEKRRMPLLGPPIPIPNEKKYIVDVPMPSDLEPGEWRFYGRTMYDCGFLFGGRANYDTEILPFKVVPSK